MVDVENEQPSKKPSYTTTARPITSPVSTTKAVDKTGYYSGGEDTEVDDDDGKIVTMPKPFTPVKRDNSFIGSYFNVLQPKLIR